MHFTHLTSEQLVDYFDGKWLPEQEREIEWHIRFCDECAKASRDVWVALGVFDSWTAKSSGR